MLEASPDTAVVVLTMENEPRFAREALRAGALGFVLKEAADSELVAAVRAALQGQRYLNPQLGGLIAAAPDTPAGPPDNLTEREVEVLRLVALGHTNAEISQQLYLSVRTVESHRAHIQQKAGRSTRAELVAYAREHGLVDSTADRVAAPPVHPGMTGVWSFRAVRPSTGLVTSRRWIKQRVGCSGSPEACSSSSTPSRSSSGCSRLPAS